LTGFIVLSGGVVSKATAVPTTGAEIEAIVVSRVPPAAVATRAARHKDATTGVAAKQRSAHSSSFSRRVT
jgi:hypothetical protein